MECAGGRELRADGYEDDVAFSSQVDALPRSIPKLLRSAYVGRADTTS